MQDVILQVPENVYDNVISYYEADGGAKLQYMEQDARWIEGYNAFKDSKSCVVTVFGIDGLVNDKISEAEHIINGTIDKEKFLFGNYVIAQGYMSDSGNDKLQPTYDVGDTVVINGRKFEVMSIAEAPYPITEGKINHEAEFSMSFFVSSEDFLEMFPENTPRKLFLNIEENKMQKVETVLAPYIENGVPVETEHTIKEHYMNEIKSATLLQKLVCIILLIIGIVNLINVLITSTVARKKEFAMMQSIGMTKKTAKMSACHGRFEHFNYHFMYFLFSEHSNYFYRTEKLFGNTVDRNLSFFHHASVDFNSIFHFVTRDSIYYVFQSYAENKYY